MSGSYIIFHIDIRRKYVYYVKIARAKIPLPKSKNFISGLCQSASENCLSLNQVLWENKQ